MGVDIFHMTLVCPFLEEQFLTKHLLGSLRQRINADFTIKQPSW